MLPLHLTGVVEILAAVIIGFWFGFILEQAGFGDCRNLAAQFYLSDMRVFKVMFSAIVTAMLLIFAASAVGLVDFDQIFVPPTYIGASVAGGLALGTGFIIGGYCPGTSLVSLATWKLDGLAFVLGVCAGLFVFGLMSPQLVDFWTTRGAMGRITIFEWLDVEAGPVVLAVLMMAVGGFFLAEWAERRFTWAKPLVPTTPGSRRLLEIVTAAGFALAGVALVVGQPDVERKIAMNQSRLDEAIQSRSMFIDPAELLNLLHNNQVDRVLLDVRSEADYNLFHIKDAVHTTIDQIDRVWRKKLNPEQVVVVMSNDEIAAIDAWKHLAIDRRINAYILAGGVNRWCEIYLAGNFNAPGPEFKAEGNDQFRYTKLLIGDQPCPVQQTPIALRLPATKGDSLSAARPKQELLSARSFQPKIRLMKAVKAPGGGCGG